MAENDQETEKTVRIDGKEYTLSDLSDTARSQIMSMRYVERQIEETKNQLAVLQAARQFYAGKLSQELPSDS